MEQTSKERDAINEQLTRLAEEALADPRPSIPAAQVFRDLCIKYGRPSDEASLSNEAMRRLG